MPRNIKTKMPQRTNSNNVRTKKVTMQYWYCKIPIIPLTARITPEDDLYGSKDAIVIIIIMFIKITI